MRVGVFLDYRFRRGNAGVTTERPFALFVFALARHTNGLTIIGRGDPRTQPYPYRVPDEIRVVELAAYESLRRPVQALPALVTGALRAWRALDGIDVLWVLGPNPLAIVTAVLGVVRGREVVLGVRQDTRAYVASRHPGRRGMALSGRFMDLAFRALARRCRVVAVGAQIAAQYAHAPAVHVLVVSLVSEDDISEPDAGSEREFAGRVISVGRLDTEKNPLLLAEIIAELARCDPSLGWRLEIYGDGPLSEALRARLTELGVSDRASLHGHVSLADGLGEAYRAADAVLHVSWTEGVPQVLLEALAARTPVVATDVGGVAGLLGDAGLLVGPDDAGAAVAALRRLAADDSLRTELRDRGTRVVRAHTLGAETARLAEFLTKPPRARLPS